MTVHLRRTAPLLAVTALLAACSTIERQPGERSPGSPTLIVAEQIEARHTNALDIVRDLRPNWLRGRGPDSILNPSQVMIYLDAARMGGPRSLSQIPASAVVSIRYLDARSATQRYGTGHASGAIVVSTW